MNTRFALTAILAFVAGTLWMAKESSASFDVTFHRITTNNAEDLSSQLKVTVYSATEANLLFPTLSLSGNDVLFAVKNAVGIASNIAEFYIDDGTVVSGPTVHNSLGGFTAFTGGSADPGNLPGGSSIFPAFVATSSFSADVDPGPPINGVNTATDILGLQYSTSGGLAGVLAAINLPVSDLGNLRIGLHIRSIGAEGGSDSYVNNPVPVDPGDPVVPEPATVIAWALLLPFGAAAVWMRRRRS